ncbi:Alpha/beta hydrolase fold-1 [Penicillium angulare]|uniref:Alpha/beta hydrolase fold-1 n=1 Tax=Penicillium angulare TaxID=116970 RepID=UPI00253F7A8C|nr:Alpha/beta hydrolase fold-1 [Penicillium angulare]KAJ5281585.1 Alpha/beta hydrolase fold-1 [Penicillium angulare]
MTKATPFAINVPDDKIKELHQKLKLATFPDELDDVGWSMGVPLNDMKRLVTTWRESFDWRAQEKKLNEQLKQFTVPVWVDGFGELDIHVVHHRSENPRSIPLLFIHGWPGNFLEATKLIPLLTKGDDVASFDVIAPSLPNFGFSQGAKKRGFGLAQYAETLHKVMIALGYDEYVIQGGDWGAILARTMTIYYSQHIKAIHVNFIPCPPPYPWRNPLRFLSSLISVPFSAKDRASIARTLGYITIDNAYSKQQSSRPQTLGYGTHDSPVALLAWIYDKLHSWSEGYAWTDEEILTWVSIYYFSRAGPSASMRIYYEAAVEKPEVNEADSNVGVEVTNWTSLSQVLASVAPASVRIAVAQFKEELVMWPMAWYRVIGNVVKENEFDRGGHFAAWEVPELLAQDLKEFHGKDGAAYALVEGRDGY